MNALPRSGDVVEWIEAFREALRQFVGDVDRVAMKVNINCDLINPEEGLHSRIEINQHSIDSKQQLDTALTTVPIAGPSRAQRMVDDLRLHGHDLDAYRPPECYDYFYAGVAYIGSIILFRERGRAPISERTLSLMAELEPFIQFMMSDLVSRHHYMRPTDRIFNQIISEVSTDFNLSIQDIRILSLMLLGFSYKQAADKMELSIDTIRKHTKRIYRKTRTGSLPELFAKYFSPRLGIAALGEGDSL